MPRRPAPTIEARIISALRVAARFGHGPLTVTMLRRYPGLVSRRYGEVLDDARRWCLEHGADKRLRIALCGYDGEHNELENHGWTVEAWKASGGYGARTDRGSENAARERIWYSPHCLSDDLPLFRALD